MKLSVHWGLQFPVATPDVPILYAGLSRLFSQRILEAVREWCFLSIRFYNCSYKEMHIISVHPLPIEIIFSQSLLHCQHSFFFSIFMWIAVCRYRKSLCWSVGDYAHAAFQLVFVSKTASSEGDFQGIKKDGVRKVLHRNSREDEEDQYTPLSQLPPLGIDYCAD